MFLDTASFIVLLIGFLLLVVHFVIPTKSTNQMMVTERGSNCTTIGRRKSNPECRLDTREEIDQRRIKSDHDLYNSPASTITYKLQDAFIAEGYIEADYQILERLIAERDKQKKSYILREFFRKLYFLEDDKERSRILRLTNSVSRDRNICGKTAETTDIKNFGRFAILARFNELCKEIEEVTQVQPINQLEVTSNSSVPNRYVDIRSAEKLIMPRETRFFDRALRFMKKLNLIGLNENSNSFDADTHLYQEMNSGGDSKSLSQIPDKLSESELHILHGLTSQMALQAADCRSLLEIVTEFVDIYRLAIDGTSKHIDSIELCGGARICNIFHETYRRALESVLPFDDLTRADVLTAMRNTRGTRPGIFVPVLSFELLIRRQIERLSEPSMNCVRLVYDEMQRMIWHCSNKIEWKTSNFPKLRESVIEIVSRLLNNRLHVTIGMVQDLLAIESAYINARYPDLVRMGLGLSIGNIDKKDGSWFSRMMHSGKPLTCNPEPIATKSVNHSLTLWYEDRCEYENCLVIEDLIVSYFLIVRKTIQDSVPKAIMHFLVNYTRDNLQEELTEQLYENYTKIRDQ